MIKILNNYLFQIGGAECLLNKDRNFIKAAAQFATLNSPLKDSGRSYGYSYEDMPNEYYNYCSLMLDYFERGTAPDKWDGDFNTYTIQLKYNIKNTPKYKNLDMDLIYENLRKYYNDNVNKCKNMKEIDCRNDKFCEWKLSHEDYERLKQQNKIRRIRQNANRQWREEVHD